MTRRVLAGGSGRAAFSWIDLEAPTVEEAAEAAERFGIPPEHLAGPARTPRPALIVKPGLAAITLAGDGADGDLVEVRCFTGPGWVLTVHDDPCPSLAEPGPAGTPDEAVDALARALVTGLVAMVHELDDDVGAIERGEVSDPEPVRRRLTALRRVGLAQRDVLIRLAAGEGLRDEQHPRRTGIRNSAERMAQIGGEVEALRETVHDATTDRQNEVVTRLTLVAAIFLPLTFLTGFFGQNFPWMVEHVGGAGWFLVLGLMLPVAVVAGILLWMRRAGWL